MNDIFYWLEGLDDLSYSIIKDYITNLQQKYEELDNRYKNSCEEYQKLVEELSGENERLKEENNNKAMNDYAHAIDESWYRELYDDYKSRCENAVKYIDTNFCIENRRDLKEVVNILQNGSDSQ